MTVTSTEYAQIYGADVVKNAIGYVRLVNYRLDMAPDLQPEEDESVATIKTLVDRL
jgi:hypothetical protein